MEYVVVFFSQSGALKFKKDMELKDITCKLSPTPRVLSSSCGTCVKITYEGNVTDLAEAEVERIFLVNSDGKYELVYDGYNM